MKVKALDPEFSALQLRYCECTLQASSPSTGLDQWENFKRDVSLYHDIDLTNPKLAEVVEQIQLKPVPFLFSLDKIVSWRVVQAAVLSALSSVTSGSKRIKSFKSDVLYRLAPGWSVGSIRTKLEARLGVPALLVWVCGDASEVGSPLTELCDKYQIQHSIRDRVDFNFEQIAEGMGDQRAKYVEGLMALYGISEPETQLNGGLEAAVIQRCAIKDV